MFDYDSGRSEDFFVCKFSAFHECLLADNTYELMKRSDRTLRDGNNPPTVLAEQLMYICWTTPFVQDGTADLPRKVLLLAPVFKSSKHHMQ